MEEQNQQLRELVAQILKDLKITDSSTASGRNPPHTDRTVINVYLTAFEQTWDKLARLDIEVTRSAPESQGQQES